MPPKKKQVDAVAEEATGEAEPIRVEWRGTKFEIPRKMLRSARVRLAAASLNGAVMVHEMLGPVQSGYFLQTLSRDDGDEVLDEFIGAVNDAAGWGNSKASL